MNILKTLRDGVHAPEEDRDLPDPSPSDASQELTDRYGRPDERQPLVVGNGLPIKVKPESESDALEKP